MENGFFVENWFVLICILCMRKLKKKLFRSCIYTFLCLYCFQHYLSHKIPGNNNLRTMIGTYKIMDELKRTGKIFQMIVENFSENIQYFDLSLPNI